ncbi:hypothetical protein DI383_02425 [Flavobacteriaceae bacterium LYZ1037]|nr:hypothetical protein DI383_02425 [Flavobacteriaceae bacterium LYZ1037]
MKKKSTFYVLLITMLIISFNGLSKSINKSDLSFNKETKSSHNPNYLEGYVSLRSNYKLTETYKDNFRDVTNCPGPINVNIDAGTCGAVVSWPTLNSDLGYTITQTVGLASGSTFPVGITTNTFEERDGSNNLIDTCSFTVTVVDNEVPTAICQNTTIYLDAAGNATLTGADIDNGSSDNCSAVTLTTSQTTFNCSDLGTLNVTLYVEDAYGNTSSCVANVTIDDSIPPTVACQDITVQLDATGNASITTGDIDDGSVDNCAIAYMTLDQTTFNCANVGNNTVTLSVTDIMGNTSSCTATVTVEDNIAPTIACPTDIILSNDTGNCDAVVTWTAPTGADNCAGFNVTSSHNPGDTFPIGTTTVTYTITDAAGLTNSCSFDVIVNDTENPTIACPGNITVSNDAGNCDAVVNWTAPTGADNCAGFNVTSSHNPGDTFPIGTTTVTYTITDAAGLTDSCSFNVTVNDTENPTIACPGNITVSNDAGNCDAVVTWTAPTGADNCAGFNVTSSHNPGDTFPIGTTTVTYTITDAAGLTDSCSFNVTVNDTENPTIACPGNITVSNDAGNCDAVVNWTAPTGADNCAGFNVTSSHNPGDTFPIGNTTVTYTITDAAGLTASCSFNVTVNDTEAPTISCPADITVSNDAGQCDAVVTWTAPTGADNCAGFNVTSSHNSGDTFPIGTTTVTYTITDAAGLTASCSFNVTVNDTEAPTISCPADITVSNDAGQCDAVVTWTAPTGADNCAGAVVTSSHNPGDTFPIGTTTVTYTITDAAGLTNSCSFDVIVNDTTAPTAICQNISITLDASGQATITAAQIDNIITPSSDNCGIQSMSLDNTAFDCSNLGNNTVTLTVTDFAGNQDFCTATVTVLDPAASASVIIVSDDANNEICDGENLTFTATPVDGGATPIYEWFIDDVSQGTNSPTFTPITLLTVGTHTVYVEMQSSLSACISPKRSNTITVIVHPAPTVTAPAQICMGDTGNLTPNTGGIWTSNNTGIATVTNAGVITPVAPGNVTFTFTSSSTTCPSTTNNVVINALPNISNLPSNNDICVNETHTLSPASGGTWISSNNSIAAITNGGVITGVAPGNVTFTFTDSATGCSNSSTAIEVLDVPVITSVTVSDDPVCAGDPSILTANVLGAGGNNETIVNYNFNTGNGYTALNGQEVTGINSSFNNGNNFPFRTGTGTATLPQAFTPETNGGRALRQLDNSWSNDAGSWLLDIDGPNLNTYQDFSIYFQTRRTQARGNNKYVRVYYRVNGTGGFNYIGRVILNDTYAGTQWHEGTFPIPAAANNSNQLEIRLDVNDGYSGGWSGPDVLIDNVQVQATTVGSTFDYSWTANTGANAGLPAGAGTPNPNNSQITVNPQVTTDYTVTVTNSDGCPETETVTVNVYPSPEIVINADYCPADDPNTPQDESQMVQLVASSNIPITSWTWLTTPTQTGNTIYVDIADTYQVIGVTANGCSEAASINIAQELVYNGDFTLGNVGFNSDYTYHQDLKVPQEWVPQYGSGWPWDPYHGGELYNDSGTNGYSITTNGNHVHSNFWGYDHTNNTVGNRNFMAVNGHGNTLVVWRQQVVVEPNTEYYFSAWGMSLNNSSERAQLTFNVDGTNVGTAPSLPTHPNNNNPGSDNWTRFYGTWTSPNTPGPQTIDIEIRNLNSALGGNDFGIDDISFATLSTFIRLTSAVGTDNQVVCQDTAITDITYDIGGGLTPPNITGLPAGLTTTFNGLEFVISGTPTEFGTFNYTITTTSSCDIKSANGTITVEEAPIVTINTTPQTVCYSDTSITLDASLTGGATVGTPGSGWTSSGTGTFDNVYSLNPVYTFDTNETGTITFTFTSDDPAGPCDAAVETVDIDITPYIIANAGTVTPSNSCANTTVTLAGNNVTGQWTVTSGQPASSYYFSNDTAYNSTFTGESGETYTLQWEATNASPCSNTIDNVTFTFANCGTNLVFDGVDDNISFADNYALNTGAFSIEAWIKPNTVSGTQTIISKRNSSSLTSGYDLSLIGNRLYFRYNASEMFATQTMNNTKWYHVAVTFDGGNQYNMYIDGFLIQSQTGPNPANNSNIALIGAMDTTNNAPINFFGGGIDEVRIWNTPLSQTQIREMMNQEIEDNGTNVRGVVVPLDIAGLQWNNLTGYYQMNAGPQTLVNNGYISDISTVSPIPGKLNKMTAVQPETAPIPYISNGNGAWNTQTTWLNGTVQQIPNTNGLNGNPVTWNIVRTQHNISSTDKNITVLGLIVDENTLTIENSNPVEGQSIRVTNYLRIGDLNNGNNDAILDLEGESQLLQDTNSIVDYTADGALHKDQQGTTNLFNYNYWSSPVSTDGNTYQIGSILHDGANPVGWTTANDATGSTNPVTLSSRWLYLYENYPAGDYASWNSINESYSVPVGLGYTMKGSGVGHPVNDVQNYTFVGKPNNGIITSPVTGGNEALVGNPYPSALNANLFIADNAGSITGPLYFWEHSRTNASHITVDYEGGYAAYSLSGGVAATTPPTGLGGIGTVGKIPRQFVPVGQGFYVTGDSDGGTITFNNNQRDFRKETTPNTSVFIRNSNQERTELEDLTKRVRLNFTSPEGAIRPLLLAFTPNNEATEGVDYGYDAKNSDYFPSDMSFVIDNENYVIQGVGEFQIDNMYPISIELGTSGTIEIELTDLENFDEEVDVFVYDALLGTYSRINTVNYQIALDAGSHADRYFIAFKNDATLNTVDEEFSNVIVNYLNATNEIYINVPNALEIKQVYLINMLGQTVKSWNKTNAPLSHECKIPVRKISEGTYIIKVRTSDNKLINKKIVVKQN